MQPLTRLLILTACLSLSLKGAKLEMCNLKSPKSVAGKRVTLEARMSVFNSNGMLGLLLTDQCLRKLPTVGVIFPHDTGMPNVDFELDENALTLLKPYVWVIGKQASIACGTFAGEFVFRRNFRRRGGEVVEGNGFGPGGAWEFAFVLQSVIEVHGCS